MADGAGRPRLVVKTAFRSRLPTMTTPPSTPSLTHIPFIHGLGVEALPAEAGEFRVFLDLEKRHTNKWGTAHGGILMSLLDVSMARAAASYDPETSAGVTIEMKVSFLQAGGALGMRLYGLGKVIHHTRTLAFCEGEVATADGKVVARATGTFKPIKRRPAAAAD